MSKSEGGGKYPRNLKLHVRLHLRHVKQRLRFQLLVFCAGGMDLILDIFLQIGHLQRFIR